MIILLILFITAVLFYNIGRLASTKKFAPPIIKYSQEPIEVSFEHERYSSDIYNLGLSADEADWQLRRAMATKVSDWMFTAIIDRKFDIADTTMYRQDMEDKFTVVTKIRILPVLRP